MKYNIVFKTKQAYNSAKTVLTHTSACRFNDVEDDRIEFYLERQRDLAREQLVGAGAVAAENMEYHTA